MSNNNHYNRQGGTSCIPDEISEPVLYHFITYYFPLVSRGYLITSYKMGLGLASPLLPAQTVESIRLLIHVNMCAGSPGHHLLISQIPSQVCATLTCNSWRNICLP